MYFFKVYFIDIEFSFKYCTSVFVVGENILHES